MVRVSKVKKKLTNTIKYALKTHLAACRDMSRCGSFRCI